MKVSRTAVPLRYHYLQYLLAVRTLIIGCQIVGFLAAREVLDYPLPVLPMAMIIAALAAFTLYSWLTSRPDVVVSEAILLLQLAVDVFAMTLLFYFSGGSANPLVSLFLLPVTVAAATLKPRYGGLIAGAAVTSYTILMFFGESVTQRHINHHDIHVHLWGMWIGFVVSAALVAYFVARIGHSLRQHDMELSRAREEALRSEKLLALGTLAASTAHDLGTPLGTMAVLTTELLEDHAKDAQLADRLTILRGQIDRCKSILSRMAVDAGQARADAGREVTVDRYLAEILDEWQNDRPHARLTRRIQGESPVPLIIADHSVTQAIRNVLNNAADASPDMVHVEAQWTHQALQIDVRDQGPGLNRVLFDSVGKTPVPADVAKDGLGIGLFLSESILNRLDGRLRLNQLDSGGVCARIDLPLRSLRTDGST